MLINLSEEVINTAYIALHDVKKDIEKLLKKNNSERIQNVLDHQMEEVSYALDVFEELVESLGWSNKL